MSSKKDICITGSTDGIGKITAMNLAKKGHRIYIHGRSSSKLQATLDEIKKASGNEDIYGIQADFSNLQEVQNILKQLTALTKKLDVIINNAGVFHTSDTQTQYGLDVRFVVNYLAPYVFTNACLDLLQEGDTRVINLSSAAQDALSYEALTGKTQATDYEVYAQSKLAITMWNTYFTKKHPGITSIAVNPGSLLNTKMVQEAFGKSWAPADKGAGILVDLALNDEYNNSGGKYFDNDLGREKGNFGTPHPDAYNEEKIEKLIRETEKLLSALSV